MSADEIRALASEVLRQRLTTTMRVTGARKGRVLCERCAPFTPAEQRWEALLKEERA